MIELVIVIAIIAFVFSIALPNFTAQNETEVTQKLGQLSSDVRNAFDLSVLSGKTYRLVFNFMAGEYWLEEATQPVLRIPSPDTQEQITRRTQDVLIDRDPTEEEEKEARENFDQDFEAYAELVGEPVTDLENDAIIPPESPLLNARALLKPPTWIKVTTGEWGFRSLGSALIIQDMQAEHHAGLQDFQDRGEEARGMIYFFPSGYVERAVIHIAYRKGDSEFYTEDDAGKQPYTLITDSWQGVAEVVAGYKEIDVHSDEESGRR